jgi:polysaccharide export outer membrane protein
VTFLRGLAAHFRALARRGSAAVLVCVVVALAGCSGGSGKPPDLPPPIQSTTLGVGDELEIRISQTKDVPTTYLVAPDGTVTLPYVGAVKIDGLEPNEIEALVRQKLIDGEFYTNPTVSVLVKGYRSKRVLLIGQVKKPDSYPLEPGMTLLRLISLAGGFTELANEDSVTIRRKMKDGSTKIVSLSVNDIIDNRIGDVPLQAGDAINVPKSAL